MIPFSNNILSSSTSVRPKIRGSVNIPLPSQDPSTNILSIDPKTINFENTSVELALGVLGLSHTKYSQMSDYDVITYYNERMTMINSFNHILALKIVLKYKLSVEKNLGKPIVEVVPQQLSNSNTNTSVQGSLIQNNGVSNNQFFQQVPYQTNNSVQTNNQYFQQNNMYQNTQHSQNNMYQNTQYLQTNNMVQSSVTNGNFLKQTHQPVKTSIPNHVTQPNRQSVQTNNLPEKLSNITVISPNEFDIDSIINNYVIKKKSGS